MEKYAVITGASSGIGREFAKQLSRKGYSLVLAARRKERLEQLAQELPTNVKVIACDLSQKSECFRLLQEIEPLNVRIFINNAGFGCIGSMDETSLETELSMLQVNVRAVHILSKKMIQRYEQQGIPGTLINVASVAGLFPAGPYMATYYATKSYVASLTTAIYHELRQKRSNIYVGCICPGPVNTEFNDVAGVRFSLPGISPKECVSIALRKMSRRKALIIPGNSVRFLFVLQRVIPRCILVPIIGKQQQRKK